MKLSGRFLVLVFTMVMAGVLTVNQVAANATVPSFASCSQLLATPGDHASYDEGIHGIVGVGNFWGADDVYSQGNGNYAQCFCAVNESGIQSDWWNVGEVDEASIAYYQSQGWFYEASGSGWNLDSDPYLIRNTEFSCGASESEPTPTPTRVQEIGGFGGSLQGMGVGDASAPMCNDVISMVLAPELFQIDMNNRMATLYFTPGVMPYNHYDIMYGYASDGIVRFATEYYVTDYAYVTAVEIGGLNPNTEYFFKVRAGNGCAGGAWSNTLIAKTTASCVAKDVKYYLYN